MPYAQEQLVANGTTTLGRIVLAEAILDIITNSHVTALAVNAGGTGYAVGETFDIVGGTAVSGFVARGIVTAVAAGVVTGVKIESCGAYSTLPGVTGAATTNASAAGNDDLTVDLTTAAATWTQDRNTYVDGQTDFEWICTSTRATNPPTIGVRTSVSAGNGAIQLMVASGYNGASQFDAQPDASPTSVTWMAVAGQNPELLISVTERRVNIASRDGNNIQYGGMGLFIPLTDADASYPFPGMVHAQSRSERAMSETYSNDGNGAVNAGVCNPGQRTGATAPPYYYRDNLSAAWNNIAQDAVSGNAEAMMWPRRQGYQDYDFTFAPQLSGQTTNGMNAIGPENGAFSDNEGSGDTGWFEDPNGLVDRGFPGVAPFGTGGQMSFVVTSHIIESGEGTAAVIGIIDGFANVQGIGLTAFEEVENYQSAKRHVVFPDTNGSDLGQWVAMEKI